MILKARSKVNKFHILLINVSMMLTLFVPFNISADTVSGSSPIIGVNITISDYESQRILDGFTVSFDDTADRWKCVSFNSSGACNAYGSADMSNNYTNHQITGTITAPSSQYYDLTNRIYEYEFLLDSSYVGYVVFSSSFGNNSNATYYINGTSFKVTATSLVRTFTISSYSLYRNSLGNEWAFPIESFPWCSYLINSQWSKYYGLNSYNSYMFPLFKFSTNDVIYSGNTGGSWTWDLILYANTSINSSNITSKLSVNKTYDTEYVFKNWTMINRYNFEGSLGYLFKVQIEFKLNGSSNPFTLSYIGSNDVIIMPIYFNPVYEMSYISTDFALNFGLSNRLLDYLEAIASSTPESQSSVDDNDNTTQEFITASDDLVAQEDIFNNDMNTSLNAIDTNFSFGNNFLASANWVSTQFNNIVNNTPFSSLITFGLILGLGLLIVGKVFK